MMEHLDDLLDIDPSPFNFELFERNEEQEKEARRQAVAARTVSKRQMRKAASEARLAEILPEEIKEGEAWHVISQGDIDAMSYLAHLIKHTPMDYVAFSTWCMAMHDVQQLNTWLQNGTIGRLEAYVGEIFPNQYPAEHEALAAAIRQHGNGGRMAVFRNHSKLFLCRAGDRAWVVESSANINTNPRAEQTVITADRSLFDFYKQFLDGIRSFNRDFDDWKPE